MRTPHYLKLVAIIATIGCALSSQTASAALSASEQAKLGIEGTPLTPMGAIRAGNADGSIPAWNPKPLAPPAGYKAGDYPDPFASEKPLFTITAKKLHAVSGQANGWPGRDVQTISGYLQDARLSHASYRGL